MTDTTSSDPVLTNAQFPVDSFGLNGNLAEMVEAALEERFKEPQGEGGEGTEEPQTPDENAGTSDAAEQPSPDPTTAEVPDPAPVDGAGGGAPEGAAPVDGGTPPASPPVQQQPGEDDFSLDVYATEYFGTPLNREQARELFGILGGLQNLTPEKKAQIEQIVTGGGTGLPQTSPAPQGPSPSVPIQAPGQPVPGLPLIPQRPTDDFPEEQRYYDQYLAPLYAQQQQIAEQVAANTQAQLAREQEQIVSTISSATEAWRESHPIVTAGEFDALIDQFAREGTLESLARSHGGWDKAVAAGLDRLFWADESLRTRALANTASGRDPYTAVPDPSNPTQQQQSAADIERQVRAGSVAGGGGGQVPRTQPESPKDPEAKRQAMTAEIAAMWGQEQ